MPFPIGEPGSSSRFMLGAWIVDPKANEMRRGSDVRRLEAKVMHVLVVLASRAGEAVSRDELIETVWPGFIVTDSTLTRCICQLRKALDDDARGPAFIHTIPKVGYRLTADVHAVSAAPDRPAIAGEKIVKGATPRMLPIRRAGLAVLMLAFALGMASLLTEERPPSVPRPITSTPGAERGVSFSRDARSIVYVARAAGSANTDLFLLDIEADSPLQLTRTREDEQYPVWSPDGNRLAFFRCADWRHCDLYVGSSVGLDSRAVLHGVDSPWGMTWIDGRDGPVYSARDTTDGIWRLFEVRGSVSVPITSPPTTIRGDLDPVAAPDGRTLAFKRSVGESVGDLFLMDLHDGSSRRLTRDAAGIAGHTWEKDGRSLLMASDRSGTNALWRVTLTGHSTRVLNIPSITPAFPVISPDGRRLVYQEVDLKHDLAEISLAGPFATPVRMAMIPGTPAHSAANASEMPFNSSFLDDRPALAPDGSAVAFVSWRSGAPEIWKAAGDGSVLRLTSFEGPALGAPAWSPDGTSLIFSAVVHNRSRLFVVDANGGWLRSIDGGEYNDRTPAWSPDGAWIYFASDRSGAWEIWRLPAAGVGTAERLTDDGGFRPLLSSSGNDLFFVQYGRAGLWTMPAEGGEARRIHDLPSIHDWGTWDVAGEGVVVVERGRPNDRLVRINPDTGRESVLANLPVSVVSGREALSIDLTSRRAVVAFSRGFETDLYIVDQYR